MSEPFVNTTHAAMLARVLIVGCFLGAFVWDVISNIGYDYELLYRWPIEKPAAVYVVSRVATFIGIGFGILSEAGENINCKILWVGLWCNFSVALWTTTLLLFFRIKALYTDTPLVVWFFFVLWLGVSVNCIPVMTYLLHLHVPNIAQTNNGCLPPGFRKALRFSLASTILPFINDLLIFGAISWKLMNTAHADKMDIKKKLRIIVFGHYLPAFSKTLLQDGQMYLLGLLPFYITSIAFLFVESPQVSCFVVYSVFPTVVAANLLTCKIYRKTRLGIHTASTAMHIEPSQPMLFNSMPHSQPESDAGETA